jgi:hypothetical protein
VRKTVAVLAILLFIVGFAPSLAIAHRIYVGWVTAYKKPVFDICLEGKATTDHGALGKGYFQFEGSGEYDDCVTAYPRNPGSYRIRLAVWKTNASNNCIDVGWVQNASFTNYMRINRPADPTGHPYASPPCGNGNYWTKGNYQVKQPDGTWSTNAKWVLTDKPHSLPTTPGGSGG